MVDHAVERRLAAILAADLVGYSRLMGEDEIGTLAAVRLLRSEAIEPRIAEHKGRLFKAMGDGFLAEFPSVVNAVACAVAIQKSMTARNAELPESRQMDLRVGVHLGDVIVEGGDVYGDGVNVAARLESLALPGGVTVSAMVHDNIGSRLDLAFEDIGEQRLKNIVKPVRVYRLMPASRPMPKTSQPSILALSPPRSTQRRGLLVIATTAAVAAVLTMTFLLFREDEAPREGLSLAVMPLSALGSDDETKLLAQGLTEDIVTDLSRFPELEIIDRNSTAAWREKSHDNNEIGKALGVRYLLDGTVQRQDNDLRISTQLLDVHSGSTVWTQRWDRKAENFLTVQSEVSEQIAAALASAEPSAAIQTAEIRKLSNALPGNLEAYQLYLLAVEGNARFTKEDIQSGISNATRAIELDPLMARAYAIRARLWFNSTHFGEDRDTAMQAMWRDAEKAVSLDPNGAEARVALAWYYMNSGRIADADAQITQALQQNPANIAVMKVAAAIYSGSGRPVDATVLADKVLKLDPLASAATLNTVKDAYFFAGRFSDAVAVISRVPEAARSRGSWLLLTFSLAMLDRKDEFQRARGALLVKYPSISAELLLNQGWSFSREEDRQSFIRGFKVSDLPLCATSADLAKIEKPTRLPECK